MDWTFNYVTNTGIYIFIQELLHKLFIHILDEFNNAKVNDCVSLANALTVRLILVAVDEANFRNYKFEVFNNCGTNLSFATHQLE